VSTSTTFSLFGLAGRRLWRTVEARADRGEQALPLDAEARRLQRGLGSIPLVSPLIIKIAISGLRADSAAASSRPFMPAIVRSVTTRSICRRSVPHGKCRWARLGREHGYSRDFRAATIARGERRRRPRRAGSSPCRAGSCAAPECPQAPSHGRVPTGYECQAVSASSAAQTVSRYRDKVSALGQFVGSFR
jgi:hypothetical protein